MRLTREERRRVNADSPRPTTHRWFLPHLCLSSLDRRPPQKPPSQATLHVGICQNYTFYDFKGNDPTITNVQRWEKAPSGNHLFFACFNPYGPQGTDCGEIDAAPFMPDEIFEPAYAKELQAYVDITVTASQGQCSVGHCYDKPFPGACNPPSGSDNWRVPCNFSVADGTKTLQANDWYEFLEVSLLTKFCRTQCDCGFNSGIPGDQCQDVPDDPTNGKFCSLCGPTFNRMNGTVGVYLFPRNDIVQLAQSNPQLSILVTALVAAKLTGVLTPTKATVDKDYTVFAPNNDAFNKLPAATLKKLLDPANIKELVEILELHVAAGDVYARDLFNGQKIRTVNDGVLTVTLNKITGVTISSGGTPASKVILADQGATNGVVHVIDTVLLASD